MLSTKPLNILVVNTLVGAGGAAAVALDLVRSYRRFGQACSILAGWNSGSTESVLSLPVGHPAILGLLGWLARCSRYMPYLRRRTGIFERLKTWVETPFTRHGEIDYAGPAGSHRLLAALPDRPDIIHAHNLHGGYFDLRALPSISARAPVVLTLHDAWMLSGHCAHSFDCERWKNGCGQCPDLTIPIALPFDHSAENWKAKAAIYRRCRLHVATPSRWLMDKVRQSMLAAALVEGRVIHNGVDTSLFRPGDRLEERRSLGLPDDGLILLFAAHGIRGNVWKDYCTLERAMARLAVPAGKKVLLLALGDTGPTRKIGDVEIRFVQRVPARTMASYYRAADLYVHAARVDNFPNVVLEALACGTAVVATAVGGIPEQIRSAGGAGADPRSSVVGVDLATGILTPAADADALATAISSLCADGPTLLKLGQNAAQDVAQRFDLDRQAGLYLEWFREINERWQSERPKNRIGISIRSRLSLVKP